MKLSIIIPTFNRNAILIKTVEWVVNATQNINSEIIIVNDNKANPIELPCELSQKVKILNNPKRGAASARNFGFENSTGDYILFLDDDILITENNITRSIQFIKTQSNSFLNLNWRYPDEVLNVLHKTNLGRFLIKHNLTNYEGWVYHPNWKQKGVIEVNKLAAFYLFTTRENFIKSGMFNEIFEHQCVEDDELSFRLKNIGIKMYIMTDEFVLHNEIDRLDLLNRLKRLNQGSYNKRIAHELGLPDYVIKYKLYKIIIYYIMQWVKPLIIKLCYRMPNKIYYEKFYNRLVHLLIGTVIFEGYYLKKRI